MTYVTPYQPHARGPIPTSAILLACMLGFVLIGLAGTFVVAVNFTPGSPVFNLLIIGVVLLALMCTLVIGLWCNGINYRIRERPSEPWQWTVPIRELGKWVPDRTVKLIRFTLAHGVGDQQAGDKEILLITRLHWIYLLRHTVPYALLSVFWVWCLILANNLRFIYRATSYEGVEHVYHIDFPAYVLMGISVVSLVPSIWLTFVGYFHWSRHFLVVTNWTVKVMWVYPVWLPGEKSNVRPVEMPDIRNVYKVDSTLGGYLGYGRVKNSTFLQEDEDKYFDIGQLPQHAEVAKIIDDARWPWRRVSPHSLSA